MTEIKDSNQVVQLRRLELCLKAWINRFRRLITSSLLLKLHSRIPVPLLAAIPPERCHCAQAALNQFKKANNSSPKTSKRRFLNVLTAPRPNLSQVSPIIFLILYLSFVIGTLLKKNTRIRSNSPNTQL